MRVGFPFTVTVKVVYLMRLTFTTWPTILT